jgi:hypothetical protein
MAINGFIFFLTRQPLLTIQFRRWVRHSSTTIRAISSPNHFASSFHAYGELVKLKARDSTIELERPGTKTLPPTYPVRSKRMDQQRIAFDEVSLCMAASLQLILAACSRM